MTIDYFFVDSSYQFLHFNADSFSISCFICVEVKVYMYVESKIPSVQSCICSSLFTVSKMCVLLLNFVCETYEGAAT